jgi:CRISPR/Cas system-associated exonuclease Cas4 (RecB family)
MALENEYEKLLRYLENQKGKDATVTPKKSKAEKKQEIKKAKASETTKKLLEEATIEDFKDIPHTHEDSKGSAGFDVLEFESMMRSKLIEEYKTSQSYERPYISCSELYNCLRQSYYARKRYQTDISSQFKFSYLYLMQKVGNTLHEIFQNLYNFSQVEKTVVSEKFKVKGRVDAIKGRHLYELKSIDAKKFKGTFLKEHYFQGVIYAYILITEYDYKIDKITIIYIFRDLKNIRSFDIDVDMALAENFLQRAPILLTALESNTIPEPIGASVDSCTWCPYKQYCEKDGYKKVVPPFMKKVKEKKTEVKEKTKEADKHTAFLL